MTLPIVPGPFSFLASLGQAGGEAFAAAEKDRQTKLKEAQDRLNQMITLRTAGLIKPDAFGSPEAMGLYHTLGIMPVSDQPTPQERLSDLKGSYLQAASGAPQQINIPLGTMGIGVNQTAQIPQTARFTDEQRRLIGVPTPDQLAVEQVQGATARAQLPDVGVTEPAEAQAKQDVTFNAQASRIVEDLYNQKGRMPTDAEAFQAAQSDPRYRVFGPQRITQPYFGKAIQSLKDKLEEQKARRDANIARASGEASDKRDRLIKLYQNNVSEIQRDMDKLPTSMGIKSIHESAYNQMKEAKANKTVISPTLEAYGKKYEAYLTALDRLRTKQNFYQSRVNEALAETGGDVYTNPDVDPAQQLRDYDEMIRSLGKDGQKKADAAGIPRPPGR